MMDVKATTRASCLRESSLQPSRKAPPRTSCLRGKLEVLRELRVGHSAGVISQEGSNTPLASSTTGSLGPRKSPPLYPAGSLSAPHLVFGTTFVLAPLIVLQMKENEA